MKIVIHAGMHKTGSTSIQNYFFRHKNSKLKYATWTSSNHSTMFVLLFGPIEKAADFHIFRRARLSIIDAQAEREKWLAALREDISRARDETFLFSAEEFSGPNSRFRLKEAAQFFREQGDVRVIAYVRPPIGYMQSALQQRLKGGNKISSFDKLYPNYRQRFEMIDNFFGRENVDLIKYDRINLHRRDVVHDFASRINIDIADEIIPAQNESLSLEAAGVLYVQRNMGSGYPESHINPMAANHRLVNALRGIGSGKIHFSASLVDPIIKGHHDDIAWIENRMGRSIIDSPGENSTVGSFDDLVAGAVRAIPELENLLGVPSRGDPTLDYALSLIEQVKTRSEQPLPSRRKLDLSRFWRGVSSIWPLNR